LGIFFAKRRNIFASFDKCQDGRGETLYKLLRRRDGRRTAASLRGGAGHCYTDEMVGARRHHWAAVTWRGEGRWLRSKKSQRLLKIWSAPNFKKALTFWGQ
jgi:hypothetical protein